MKNYYIENSSESLDLMELSSLETISKENLIENGGTLSLTFFDMLKVLHKHNIIPYLIRFKNLYNSHCLGYCMFYYSEPGTIQISHICVNNKHIHEGIGTELLNHIKNWYNFETITADISYNNTISQNFFKKHDFVLENNEEKQRYRAIYKV